MACADIAKRIILTSFLFIAGLFSFHKIALGQAFETGYQAFKSGNYEKAEFFLKKSLKKTSDPYDLAFTYKLLGISQYKIGQKSNAFKAFQKAHEHDPKIEIADAEAKDRSIQRLFAKAKTTDQDFRKDSRRRGLRSQNLDRRSEKIVRKKPTAAEAALMFAPFGVAQFKQHKNLLGGLLASGQVGALVAALMMDSEFKANDKATEKVWNDYRSGNSSFENTELERFLNESEKYGKQRAQNRDYFFMAFVGLYAAGVAEAYLKPPRAQVPSRKKSKRNGFRGTDSSPDRANEQIEGTYVAERTMDPGPKFAFYSNFNLKNPQAIFGLDLNF